MTVAVGVACNVQSEANDHRLTVRMLLGKRVRMRAMERHDKSAIASVVLDGGLSGLPFTTIPGPDEIRAYIDGALELGESGAALPFVVEDDTGKVVGVTRFYQFDPTVRRVWIGGTFYTASAQRTYVNTECKLLMLRYAFYGLGCESVAFETSHLNLRSQAAIARLGARLDGVQRAAMRHRDGTIRNNHLYSVVAGEWPVVEARLAARLR